jgi:hypothetical protein
MKLTKEEVVAKFKKAKTLEEFESFMESHKFRAKTNAANKIAYVNPKQPFVVKLVYQSDRIPRRTSRLARYYLYPEKAGRRTLHDGDCDTEYRLLFQQRVTQVGSVRNYVRFKKQLEKEKIVWDYMVGRGHDNHEYNMGILDGEPRIIDL